MVLLLIGLSVCAGLLKPWPLAVIVDSLLGDKPLPDWVRGLSGATESNSKNFGALLLLLTGLLLSAHLLQAMLSALYNWISIGIGLDGLKRIRSVVYERLLRLSSRYHQNHSAGDLVHRIAWDTCAFQTLFQQGVVAFCSACLSLVLMLTIMARVNMPLTLVALATVPALLVAMRFFGKRMASKSTDAQEAEGRITAMAQQTMLALPVIRVFTREAVEGRRFGGRIEKSRGLRYSQHGWEVGYLFIVGAIFAAGIAAIVWMGAREVQAGNMTIGELLVFVAYLGQFYDPLNQLSHVGSTVAGAKAGANRVFDVLDSSDEVSDLPQARSVTQVQGALEFSDLTFGYNEQRPVLRSVSFAIEPGWKLAVVGPSGAGKTTVLNLISRFYDPESGEVRLDGQPLRELRLHDLRKQIGVVPQEPVLFPGSVAENIALGDPDASRERIVDAARAAGAAEFIERLVDDYDSIVGEGNARLSVGECQRLCLARAFLKNAPLLLLDEPTSALDAENERQIAAALKRSAAGKTIIVVAHQPEMIRDADRVLVLERGEVAAFGTPEEVVAKSEFFAKLLARNG